MKEKVTKKIVENYSKFIEIKNRLDENIDTPQYEEKIRNFANILEKIVAETDFEEVVVKSDMENYYNKDITLTKILKKRNGNIVINSLRENKIEILQLRVTQLSNVLYHYLERKNNVVDFKGINKSKINNISRKTGKFVNDNQIKLEEIIKDFKNYDFNYVNKKCMSEPMKKYVDFLSKNGIDSGNIVEYCKNITEYDCINKVISHLKDVKISLTEKIIRNPNTIKIFFEPDEKMIDGEKSVRLYLTEKNGYLYNQFHFPQRKLSELSKKYKSRIKLNNYLEKSVSPTIGINFTDEEKEYYEKNKTYTKFDKYICYYDKCIEKQEEEHKDDKREI